MICVRKLLQKRTLSNFVVIIAFVFTGRNYNVIHNLCKTYWLKRIVFFFQLYNYKFPLTRGKGNTIEILFGQRDLNIYNGFDCDVLV